MESVTDTGVSTLERLANTWLNFQLASKTVDLETQNSARNVPDRVDVQTGVNSTAVASKINWQMIGLGAAALLGVGLLLKLAR
jgi:hypothetical protein